MMFHCLLIAQFVRVCMFLLAMKMSDSFLKVKSYITWRWWEETEWVINQPFAQMIRSKTLVHSETNPVTVIICESLNHSLNQEQNQWHHYEWFSHSRNRYPQKQIHSGTEHHYCRSTDITDSLLASYGTIFIGRTKTDKVCLSLVNVMSVNLWRKHIYNLF